MDQLPRTEMHTNLIWSVRGNINADSKKGNVEKNNFKIHCFRGKLRRIHSRKSVRSNRGNPKSIRGNPEIRDNLRKEKPIKSKQNRRHAEQLPISRLKPACWLRWRVVGTSFGGWSESEAQSARGHEPMNFFHEYGQ